MFDTLVTVEDVAKHLDDPSWVIVDCRHTLADFSLGRRFYNEAHIPGAFFADTEHDLAGEKTGMNGRHPMPEPEDFANVLRAMGVNDGTQVVAYDAGGDMFAARLWLLCRWIGHDAAAVLDGGLSAWLATGQPMSNDVPIATRVGNLSVKLRSDLVVDHSYVAERLQRPEMQLLDARAADRFAGQNEVVDPVAGHIPGAANRPFKSNFDERGFFKKPETLRAELAQHDPKRVIHQCGSGVSATVNMLAMELAGSHGSRLYGGSWSEWIADPSRPVERG